MVPPPLPPSHLSLCLPQTQQFITPETSTLLPGDSLVTTCTYNSTNRTSSTSYGLSSTDEMCYHYLLYYPAIPLMDTCEGMSEGGLPVSQS